jgi:hypothetical protein
VEANHHSTTTAPAEPPPPPGEAAPDWTSSRDLHCPLCDYNLRGLTEPRCPECGYHFRWEELLDEKLQFHPYLFEHHPEREVWSFWKTAVGGLRPARFWTKLHAGQPSRPGRLLAYWVIAMLVALLAAVAAPLLVGTILENDARAAAGQRAAYFQSGGTPVYWTPSGVYSTTPPPRPGYFDVGGLEQAWDSFGKGYAIWWGIAVAWAWATSLTLMVFKISMRRAKVRAVHVRRCVLYSFDACLWAALYVLVLTAAAMAVWMAGGGRTMFHWLALVCLPVLWWIVTYRLGRAYRDYLKFDHPWATVIATQIIVGLTALIIAINVMVAGMR